MFLNTEKVLQKNWTKYHILVLFNNNTQSLRSFEVPLMMRPSVAVTFIFLTSIDTYVNLLLCSKWTNLSFFCLVLRHSVSFFFEFTRVLMWSFHFSLFHQTLHAQVNVSTLQHYTARSSFEVCPLLFYGVAVGLKYCIRLEYILT